MLKIRSYTLNTLNLYILTSHRLMIPLFSMSRSIHPCREFICCRIQVDPESNLASVERKYFVIRITNTDANWLHELLENHHNCWRNSFYCPSQFQERFVTSSAPTKYYWKYLMNYRKSEKTFLNEKCFPFLSPLIVQKE